MYATSRPEVCVTRVKFCQNATLFRAICTNFKCDLFLSATLTYGPQKSNNTAKNKFIGQANFSK